MSFRQGFYLAIVATIVETDNPESELNEGLKLLGPVLQKFVSVDDLKVNLNTSLGRKNDDRRPEYGIDLLEVCSMSN